LSSAFGRKNLVLEPRFLLLIAICRSMNPEPITQAAAPRAVGATPGPAASVPGESRQPLRILAADDVRTNRELIRQLARHHGCEAEVVENGAEVLAAMAQGSFDLILLDVQMPVMDGLDAAREIVRLQPDPSRRPRILALTASAWEEDRQDCLAAGMDDCLAKPITSQTFKACIDRLFSKTPPVQTPAEPVPPASPEELPLVDCAQLDAAVSGLSLTQMSAIHHRMHRAVARDFETFWPLVVDAVSKRDQVRLAEAVHALKGCFSILQWSRITAHCASALQRARAQRFAEWSTFPGELQHLYTASTAEMTRYLAASGSGKPPAPPPNGGRERDASAVSRRV
jgi:CheY-like chemotaxis protein